MKGLDMTETDRDKLLRILADLDYNGGGMMRWHPSGEPTEMANRVADSILAAGFGTGYRGNA